jgi:hypothetical protein
MRSVRPRSSGPSKALSNRPREAAAAGEVNAVTAPGVRRDRNSAHALGVMMIELRHIDPAKNMRRFDRDRHST